MSPVFLSSTVLFFFLSWSHAKKERNCFLDCLDKWGVHISGCGQGEEEQNVRKKGRMNWGKEGSGRTTRFFYFFLWEICSSLTVSLSFLFASSDGGSSSFRHCQRGMSAGRVAGPGTAPITITARCNSHVNHSSARCRMEERGAADQGGVHAEYFQEALIGPFISHLCKPVLEQVVIGPTGGYKLDRLLSEQEWPVREGRTVSVQPVCPGGDSSWGGLNFAKNERNQCTILSRLQEPDITST